jgi:hypothetical protein
MGTVTATVTDASGLTASSSVAYTVTGGTGPQATVYTAEPLGAGGWVTGITISPDGLTRLVRTDTMGAWRWDTATDAWVACITGTSMPSP